VLGVERGKLGVEGLQRFIGDAADQAQRVVRGDPALRADVAEKSVPPHVIATHPKPPLDVDPTSYRIRCARIEARTFSAACQGEFTEHPHDASKGAFIQSHR
jgi:hypothetical protein